MNLQLSADDVLTTTRAVRKRLDLDRPVPREVLLDCLQIAVQAPTASNRQAWQWMFVEDAAKKEAIAERYRAVWEGYAKTRIAEFPDDDLRTRQRPRVMSSAQYLSDNFHRVPVMMIPLVEGRLDNGPAVAQASSWGSILPAVWSFMLAARARGLGTSWTTVHLEAEQETAALLGIPWETVTQVALVPVAHTVGDDFKPAARLPLDGIVHFDSW